MAWYIPVYNDKMATGSDCAFHSDYVRKDKVREVVSGLIKRKFNDQECTELYRISDTQFWDRTWDTVEGLRKIGVKLFERR